MIKAVPVMVLATSNVGKARELAHFLEDTPVKVTMLRNAGAKLEGSEGECDYEQNAIAKARRAAQAEGKTALGEDSGLEVECLGGKPGPMSARYVSADATATQKNEALLGELEKTPDEGRAAKFVSLVAIAEPSGAVKTFRGECCGRIAVEERGNCGFGYDPVFIPDGHEKTLGELGLEVKNKLSHRAMAMAKARAYLEANC